MTCFLKRRWLWVFLAVGAVVLLLSGGAFAAESSANKAVLDGVINTFKSESTKWAYYLQQRAKWVFWILASISCVLRFTPLALGGGRTDFSELIREAVMFVLTTGFFYWLLTIACVEGGKGSLVQMIVDSFIKMGSGASSGGSVESFSPSGIVSLGLKLMWGSASCFNLIKPGTSIVLLVASFATFIVLLLIAAKMCVVLIGAWFTAYSGLFLLSFGGSHFTKDITLSYLKGCLAVGVKVMVFCLLVGFGESYLTGLCNDVLAGKEIIASTYTPANTASFTLSVPTNIVAAPDIWAVLAVSIILFIIVSEVPDTVSGFISGFGGVHSLGSSVSAGSMMYQASRAASMASAGAGNVVGAGAALSSSVIQAREQNANNEGLFKGSDGAGTKTLGGGFSQALGISGKAGALAFGVRTAGSVAKNLFSGAMSAADNKSSRTTLGGVNQAIKVNAAKEANNRSGVSVGGIGQSETKKEAAQAATPKTGSISGVASSVKNTSENAAKTATVASSVQTEEQKSIQNNTTQATEISSNNSMKSELNSTTNVGSLANMAQTEAMTPSHSPLSSHSADVMSANTSADTSTQSASDVMNTRKEDTSGEI